MPIYRNRVTAGFLDGSLAVSIFFVLSGEALSSSYFSGKGRQAVYRLAIRRYPRLVIPILAISLITASILWLGFSCNLPAAKIVERADWLGMFLRHPVDFQETLRFAFVGVFRPKDPRELLVPFLWTMRVELLGSVTVFICLVSCHGRIEGWPIIFGIFTIFAIAAVYDSMYGQIDCFLAGLFFARIRYANFFKSVQRVQMLQIVSWVALFLLMAIASYLHARDILPLRAPILAILLCFFCFCNRRVTSFLENRISEYLGKISFPLFLVQFPVIVTFTSWAILLFANDVVVLSPFIIFASLLACLICARLFEPIELFTMHFGKILTACADRAIQHLIIK